MNKISVGIPTFNSSKYLSYCLKSLSKLTSVDEIIISDDGSTDDEYKKIEQIVREFKFNNDIELLKNKMNLGAYVNKLNLMKASKNKYIYILDSDNLAGKNLDEIIKNYVLTEKNDDVLFQPNIMYQFWKNPKSAKILSNFDSKYKVKFFNKDMTLEISDVKESLLLNSGDYELSDIIPGLKKNQDINNEKDILLAKWIFWILNCGNFVANKDTMIDIAEEGLGFDRSLRSVDAIVFSYLWISNKKSIKIPKNFYHHHRKREDSVSFTEKEDSKNAIKYFMKEVLTY